jgi:HTH-type transcriptional regulator/antitoxin HigA
VTLTFDNKTYQNLLAEFPPKVITTEEEYDFALATAEKLLFNKNRLPEESALLNLFVLLIEKYEQENYPFEPVSPQEMLEHLMDAGGLRQADLVGVLGFKGVVSEILSGKRSISKAQAKVLGEFFHVSPALFI